MKVTVKTSKALYDDHEEIQKLKSLGFKFKDESNDYGEFLLLGDTEINVNTMFDLIQITNEFGRVIFDGESIQICDDYIE